MFLVIKKKTIAFVLAGLLAAAGLIFSLSGANAAAVYFGTSLRKIPIYRVDTQEKKIALTFDAAWGADKTEGIMEILKEYGADATFFLVGFWMESYPEMTQKIAENGFEIGTHSNTHPHMSRLDTETIVTELTVSCAKINSLTDQQVTLFRAPFGEYNDKVMTAAEGLGLQTIQWDVDSLDWKNLTASEITLRIAGKVQPGSIILCHNNGLHTAEALPAVLATLKNSGYEFVPVGELIHRGNFTMDANGRQHAAS